MGWTLYMMWAVIGFMMLDFVICLIKSLVTKSFTPKVILDYLKDLLFYIYPLFFTINILSVDPTGWVLLTFYYIGSLGVVLHYLVGIKNKWKA